MSDINLTEDNIKSLVDKQFTYFPANRNNLLWESKNDNTLNKLTRRPEPGYCLRFNNINGYAYIDTGIKSKIDIYTLNLSTDLLKGYVTYRDGSFVSSTSYSCSDFLEIKPNTTYFAYGAGVAATSNMATIAFYDKDKKFIKAYGTTQGKSPDNALYCRIVGYNSTIQTCGNYMILKECVSPKKYNIIIKGEGNYEWLTSSGNGDTYIIKYHYGTPSSTSYFDLSYVAFVNNETKKIDHLFTFEEKGLTDKVYDSITGTVGYIKDYSDLSLMRVSSINKEYIKDYSDLENEIYFTSVKHSNYLLVEGYKKCPKIFTLCDKINFCKFNSILDDNVGLDSNMINIIGWDTSKTTGIFIYLGRYLLFKHNSVTILSIDLYREENKYIIDNKYHSIVYIAGETYFKIYIDNILISTVNRDPSTLIDITYSTEFRIGESTGLSVYLKHKDPRFYGIDLSNKDLPILDNIIGPLINEDDTNNYTVEDYHNGVLPINVQKNTPLNLPNGLCLASDGVGGWVAGSVFSYTHPTTGFTGTQTRINNATLEYDNFCYSQWTMYPRITTDTRSISTSEDGWMYAKYKIDLYSENATTGEKTLNVDARLVTTRAMNNPVTKVTYLSGAIRYLKVYDENGNYIKSNILYLSDYSSSVLSFMAGFSGGEANSGEAALSYSDICRDSKDVSKVRYIELFWRPKYNLGITRACDFKPTLTFNSVGGKICITGTIELVDCGVINASSSFILTNNISTNTKCTSTNTYENCLLQVTSQSGNRITTYRNGSVPIPQVPTKQYGSFSNAYGYNISKENADIHIPRKARCEIINDIPQLIFEDVDVLGNKIENDTGIKCDFSPINYTYVPAMAAVRANFNSENTTISEYKYIVPNPMQIEKNQLYKNNFGADVEDTWDIDTGGTPSAYSAITKNNWTAVCTSTQGVIYLKPHDTADLPSGVNYGIDLRTQYGIGYSGSSSFFYYSDRNIYTYNNHLRYYGSQLYAKISFWIKKYPNIKNSEFIIGINYNNFFKLNSTYISNMSNEWEYIEGIYPIILNVQPANSACYVGISWTNNESAPYSGSIAGFSMELYPKETKDDYKPLYKNNIDHPNNIKYSLYNKELDKDLDIKRNYINL